MLKRLLEIYKLADIIGSEVQPTFNFEKQVKSYHGATLSIALIIIAVIGFGFFGSEIINKKNVRSTLSQLTIEESELKLSEFPTMFLFRQSGVLLNFDQRFLRSVKISAHLSINGTSGSSQITSRKVPIPVVNCSTIKWNEVGEARFVELGLDKRAFFCLNFDAMQLAEEEKSIRNSYGTAGSRTLVILVSKCDEKADPGQARLRG